MSEMEGEEEIGKFSADKSELGFEYHNSFIKIGYFDGSDVLADKLGISRRAVAKQISRLQEENIIRRVGADKGGHWEIV